MTSRAAILPFPGDPFLLHYWLKHYTKFWRDEVDKLYIFHNSPIGGEVEEYIEELCNRDPKIVYLHEPRQIDHGEVIDKTLDVVEEQHVLLLEDDCFIFKSNAVNSLFKWLESGEFDVIGSPRGSCSIEILEAAKERWGLDYRGVGDRGCSFWPCLFFSSKKLLTSTDRRFGAKHWNEGDYIEELDLTLEKEAAGDTFVNTSLQIRSKVPQRRIMHIPQYHGHPDDFDHYKERKFLFDGKAPWVHIGSLSSGVSGLLRDYSNRTLSEMAIKPPQGRTNLPNKPTSEFEKREYERRVQWWLRSYEKREQGRIKDFADLYHDAIYQIIDQFKLSKKRILQRQRIYNEIGLL